MVPFPTNTMDQRGETLKESEKISYSCLKDQEAHTPAREFGLHSLRAGGATAAANSKVPDRCFKRHGRWRSENAKDSYVKDTLESGLEIYKNL